MIRYLMTVLALFCANVTEGQNYKDLENVVITSGKEKTRVYTENGVLHVNVNSTDVRKYKKAGVVSYQDFGVKGMVRLMI